MGYWTLIPAIIQKSSNVGEVNSPALSSLNVLIGLSGNCALSLRMWASNLEKTRFLVDNRDVWDHLEEASIMTRKKRNGPLAGVIGPQTST